jgi:poly(A) polymerase
MTGATARTDRSLAGAAWLSDGPLTRLLAVLDADGEEARAIGGAVRDALLGKEPAEVDVATTAPPREVIRRVEHAGFKAVPTGIDHGTVTVVIAGRPFEVTTLREDIETFGRKAIVRFGRDWRADAERRDFTINALSVSPDGTVHDYVGGLADLGARRVRFIGDAATRIAEDYLRILRFFRFHAAYGEGPPDAAGLKATIAARHGLEKLSRERVRMELIKLIQAPRPVATLTVMAEAGILGPVLGGVPLLPSLANMIGAEQTLGIARDVVRELGALAVQVAEDAERLCQRLRLSNAEHEQLASMSEGWRRITPALAPPAARALLYRLGPARYSDRVLLAWARSGTRVSDSDPAWHELATLPARWAAPVFPLRAADLIRRGLSKGPDLGRALRAAEQAWIDADFPGDPVAVAAIADTAVRSAARAR